MEMVNKNKKYIEKTIDILETNNKQNIRKEKLKRLK